MRTLILTLILGIVYQATSSAGEVYHVEMRELDGSANRTDNTQISVDGRQLRIEAVSTGSGQTAGALIFHGDSGQILIVDDTDKSYAVIDRNALGAVAKQMNAAMQELQAQLEQLPAEQREMMEKMLKQRMGIGGDEAPSTSEFNNTGIRETVNGYACLKYELLQNGTKTSETCVADWSTVGVPKESFAVIGDLTEFYGELLKSKKSLAGALGGQGPGADGNPFERWRELDGFPVAVREFRNGAARREAVVKSVEQKPLEPELFQPPAGYTKRSLGIEQ